MDGRVALRWGLRHPPVHGGTVVQGLLCSLGGLGGGVWGDHHLLATLMGWLKTQEQVSGEGWMVLVCTCGGGAAKIISANEHVLRHVSSSPGPFSPPQQLGGGWTRAKEPWEQRGRDGLRLGLCKES